MSEPDGPDEQPRYSAGAVARRLGIAPTTLRSWHHRYGLGPVASQPGTHRRYTEHDITALETMARLVAQGVVPAAAAELVNRVHSTPLQPSAQDGLAGRIAAQAVRGLVLAALRLDAEALRHVLDAEFTAHGLERTWEELCVPALTRLGRRVTPEGDCIDAILLLSCAISASMHLTAGPTASTSRARRTLLACTDGERHSLGLEVLQGALTARRIPVNMLGASVPAPVVVAAAGRIRPAAVIVWSQVRRTARIGVLRKLIPLAGTTIAAGPGWDTVRLPPAVVHVTSLSQAIDCVMAATSFGRHAPG